MNVLLNLLIAAGNNVGSQGLSQSATVFDDVHSGRVPREDWPCEVSFDMPFTHLAQIENNQSIELALILIHQPLNNVYASQAFCLLDLFQASKLYWHGSKKASASGYAASA